MNDIHGLVTEDFSTGLSKDGLVAEHLRGLCRRTTVISPTAEILGNFSCLEEGVRRAEIDAKLEPSVTLTTEGVFRWSAIRGPVVVSRMTDGGTDSVSGVRDSGSGSRL